MSKGYCICLFKSLDTWTSRHTTKYCIWIQNIKRQLCMSDKITGHMAIWTLNKKCVLFQYMDLIMKSCMCMSP